MSGIENIQVGNGSMDRETCCRLVFGVHRKFKDALTKSGIMNQR